MSEISYYETTINVSRAQVKTTSGNIIDGQHRMNILNRAMEIVAQDHDGGRISTDIRDADGKPISCLTGILTRDFPLGVGVSTDSNGKVTFVYETKGDSKEMGRILSGEISANYNAIALQMALMQMNMAPEMQVGRHSDGRRKICITGRI
jgi:hypothetical protein